MTVKERFLKYIGYPTTSNEESTEIPSTSNQKIFGEELVREMKSLGIHDAKIDEKGYIYGSIPAAKDAENEKVIGLIAHMDTSPSMHGEPIKPSVIEQYNGKDIVLNQEKNIVMKPAEFPHLINYIGQDLIVTDGTTLLGADDKAGIAEILTLSEFLLENPQVKHGKLVIGFTPDEEIGRGADYFNVGQFGADFAYTVDGGELGELEYENFNAASGKVTVQGVNIHPGEAKGKMKNASLIGMEFHWMLPSEETPSHTENYEGFYHLCHIHGEEETARLDYIIRDHHMEKFEQRKNRFYAIAAYLNEKYGEDTIEVTIKDSYYNMKKQIEPHMHIIERVQRAMEKNGVTPKMVPIRGGTDGARLSFMGLPCPNISTGGHNFHGKYEYIPVQSMEKMVEVLKDIVTNFV